VYERVTLDDVAARTGKAKTTLYRRWATKDDLILAAIRSIGRPPEMDRLPDQGSLRSDLLAVIDSPWLGGPERRLSIFAGLASAARRSESLAEAIRVEVTEPYVGIYRRLLDRAIDRGEVPPGTGRTRTPPGRRSSRDEQPPAQRRPRAHRARLLHVGGGRRRTGRTPHAGTADVRAGRYTNRSRDAGPV
jgi:AcrR family transcriptional regulator